MESTISPGKLSILDTQTQHIGTKGNVAKYIFCNLNRSFFCLQVKPDNLAKLFGKQINNKLFTKN